jgi:hypothetical protein
MTVENGLVAVLIVIVIASVIYALMRPKRS